MEENSEVQEACEDFFGKSRNIIVYLTDGGSSDVFPI